MKRLVFIFLAFTTLACKGQDTIFICKEKNLLIPNEYIKKNNKENNNIYADLIPKCKDVEVISDSYDFLFTGFEKYGYTLCIDTTSISYSKNQIIAKIVGYFDLVNNTDSIIEAFSFSWRIDNMGFNSVKNGNTFKQGESKKIKFVMLTGAFPYRIVNHDFDPPLMPIVKEDSIISNKRNHIDNLNLMKRLKNSNAYFRISNRLFIHYNGKACDVSVTFMIPVKYIRDIEYSCFF